MLTSLDPKKLRIFSNDRDLLRDLITYFDYVCDHEVKRMTRTNGIPQADLNRLAKLLGIEPPQKDDWMNAREHWIDFIDGLALHLELIDYDTKGEYRGYSSSEPSFVENFIEIKEAAANNFFELPPAGQEKKIMNTLINYSGNECYHTSILGELDGFYQIGSAIGVMPTLKFPVIRQFLLDVIKTCPPGQWLSVESLVAYLKADHPYFLIPKNAAKTDKWGKSITRYCNFYEGKDRWVHNEKPIPDDAPDGFERVEGRYVERFLENIPLTMRFVDVAYDPEPYKGLMPTRGALKAFRITERFLRLMSGEESQPRLTVQPNFDIVIESDFYPAQIIQQIAALGEQVSAPTSGHSAYVGVYQLQKTRVAAEQALQPKLDVNALLKKLSGRDLPPNVQVELEEWSGHADQFTLYEGFALLESVDEIPEAEKFTVERIAPTLRLVRAGDGFFSMLEKNAYAPLWVFHLAGEFIPLTESAISLFPKESVEEEAQRKPKQVMVSRSVSISYQFPDEESFMSVQKMLAELRCPFQSDPITRTIHIQQKEQARFDEAVQALKDSLLIEFQ